MLNTLIETFIEKPLLLALIIFFIAFGYGAIQLSRFRDRLKQKIYAQDLNIETNKSNFYQDEIDAGRESIGKYSYQGDDVNTNDFYDRNYRDDHENIISICNDMIAYIIEHKEYLDPSEAEDDLDFFYYRLAEAYEFTGKYDLAAEAYKKSLECFKDKETETRLNICLEKLKGNNENI